MSEFPLISCIMPTANRSDFVKRAITYFHAQDYPNKELIIVEDGNTITRGLSHNVIYRHIGPTQYSIGDKRNYACTLAHGDIICGWDDDDYYGPQRLSKQVKPILTSKATITAMKMSLLFHKETNTLWQCSTSEHKNLFKYDVRCGTLMYGASYWRDGLHYQSMSRGEDVAFLDELLKNGATLQAISDPNSYICIRHDSNTTDDMTYADNPNWKKVPIGQRQLTW